ncbi:hypothetical protein HOLleu_15899 [Holothuria leucospilota]|uniref:Uncharacterized protein n=1 Tax=Holothuria leucospilota TaxID=206669 RepID=A0A9Q1C5I7_HOLLE|nr:hypothetical protein HOLleu_15899 [Holothuria leucospilota]
METYISGRKCKFDMRIVLFRDLRTKTRMRYRKFHCSKRLARVHFYNAFYTRRIHFSLCIIRNTSCTVLRALETNALVAFPL